MSYLFIIKQLLNNGFLFISFISIWGIFSKDKKYLLTPTSPARIKILYGIIMGILGGISMTFIVREPDSLKIDFQNLAIFISAINGGYLCSFIAGVLIFSFSVVSFGVSQESLIILTIILSISIGCGFISKLNIQKSKKWIYMISYSLILQYIFMSILFPMPIDMDAFYKNFIIYSILTFIFGFILYNFLEYIDQSNLLFIKFKEDSSKDFLTGLNNVREFDSLFSDLSKKAIEKKERLSLIMIDIDWFKKINDTYGHNSGDEVLKQISVILKRTCRTSDIVSRNGGEEFSVLLINCMSTQSLEIGEQIRKAIENNEFILPTGERIKVSISAGVATYPDIVNKIERLKESADSALYEAKRTGRNKVVQYN